MKVIGTSQCSILTLELLQGIKCDHERKAACCHESRSPRRARLGGRWGPQGSSSMPRTGACAWAGIFCPSFPSAPRDAWVRLPPRRLARSQSAGASTCLDSTRSHCRTASAIQHRQRSSQRICADGLAQRVGQVDARENQPYLVLLGTAARQER